VQPQIVIVLLDNTFMALVLGFKNCISKLFLVTNIYVTQNHKTVGLVSASDAEFRQEHLTFSLHYLSVLMK